jgi:hypothetical protein
MSICHFAINAVRSCKSVELSSPPTVLSFGLISRLLTRQMDVYVLALFLRVSLVSTSAVVLRLDPEAADLAAGCSAICVVYWVSDPCRTQGCIEASPDTLDAEKVETLAELGIQRLSLGVQSSILDELQAVNRRFDFIAHREAIDLIRTGPVFLGSTSTLSMAYLARRLLRGVIRLQQAIDSPANGLFLYPLYISPAHRISPTLVSRCSHHAPNRVHVRSCRRSASTGGFSSSDHESDFAGR